ncbi:PAS domain S-box protein [Litoribacter populi]|uniref:PAS domain S-box protein n=1 Tax=Litoribacter populi TaxID=2598460 RepID=UPI001180420B|nr:PAS domain S-box protein [Litoribacter populi]
MDLIFKQIFNHADTPSVVFDIDSPQFTIVDVNDAYLKIAFVSHEQIIGKTLFEAFPTLENQEQGAEDLLFALEHTLNYKEHYKLAVLRYDIYNHISDQKEEKYWEFSSQPILDESGEVKLILVKAYDITDHIINLMAPKIQSTLSEEIDFKFKNIFELSSVAIALLNLDGIWVEINPKMTDYLGYSHWEYLNQRYAKIVHPGDIDGFEAGLDQLRSGKKTIFNTEMRFYHRTGKTIWFYASITLIKDRKYKPLHYVAHFIDITDRKEIELALLESEQRYQSLFHHNPDPVFAFNLDGKFISANDATCKLIQLSLDELLGNLFLPYIPLEDKRRVFDNFLQASEGKSLSYNTGFLTSTGEAKTMHVTNMPIISNGKIVGVYGIAKDVTDKLQAETAILKAKDQYEQLISTIDGMVWESDENLKTIYVSPQTREILGFSPEEWYNHENFWFEHVLQEDRNALWKAFLEGMETGKNFTFESRMIAANGNTVWLRNNVAIIKRKGRTTILRGVMTDITKAKDAQQALEGNEAKLKKILNQSLDVICTISPDGNFIDVSNACMKVWGYSPEELAGQPYENYLFENDKVKTAQAASDILSGVDLTNFENRYIHKDGHLIDMAWSVHFDFGEKIMFCVAKDVTERKSYEAALNQSFHRYELVTQATSDAIWDWDLKTGHVFRGSGFLKIFGHDHAIMDNDTAIWKKLIHPKDQERITESISRFLASEETNWEEEYRYMKADGDYAYVLDKAMAVRDHNYEPQRMVGALADVTQDRFLEREDKLRIDLGAVFRNENTPHKALRQSLDVILEFTELTYGEVWFKPSDKDELTLSAFTGNIIHSPRDFPISFAKGEGIHGKAWDKNQKLFFTDLKNSDEFERKEFAMANELESAVVFPIGCNGETIAIYSLFAQDKNTLIRSTSQISLSICEQLATDFVCKKAENDLNLFFEISGDMLFIAGMEGKFKKVNKAAKDLLGYSESEMLNSYFMDWVHPEDLAKTKEVFKGMTDGATVQKIENRILTQAGQYIWVSWTSTSVIEEGVIFSVGRDITERKAYEEQLKASKDEVTETLDSIQDAFYAMDKNWTVTYWNKEAERLLHRTKEEMIGANLWEEFPAAVELMFYDKYNEVLETKTPVSFIEYFHPLENWYEMSAYPKADGVSCFFKEITQRVEQEKELEKAHQKVGQILESITDAFLALDRNWNITYWNQEAERFLGVKRDDVIGKSIWDSFPEAVTLAFYEKYHKVMNERVPLNFEEYFPPVEGWFDVTAYPSEDGITVYFKNINDRKRLELELLQFKKVIENSKEGVGIVNFEQKTHYRNPALLSKLGYSNENFAGIDRPSQFFKDPKKAKEVFDVLLEGNYYDGVVTLIRNDGEEEEFHLSAGPILDEKERVVAVFGIHSEIKKENHILQ